VKLYMSIISCVDCGGGNCHIGSFEGELSGIGRSFNRGFRGFSRIIYFFGLLVAFK